MTARIPLDYAADCAAVLCAYQDFRLADFDRHAGHPMFADGYGECVVWLSTKSFGVQTQKLNLRKGVHMTNVPGIDVKAMKRRLLARRKELEKLIESSADTRADSNLDQQRVGRLSRVDALQQQAMEEETGRRREHEITRINAALKRIEDDDYGFCTACDEPIAPKRLENDPATPLCIACAERAS